MNRVKSYNLGIMMFCLILLFINFTSANILLGEYRFSQANGTTQIYATSNTSNFPRFYTPVGYYGVGYSAFEPTFDDRGVVITVNKFLKANIKHNDYSSNSDHVVGLWLYYITGSLGRFLDLDYRYNHSTYDYQGYYRLNSYISGSDMKVNYTMKNVNTQFGIIKPGWNFIMVGLGSSYTINSMCNDNASCYDSTYNPIPLISLTSGTYGNVNELGGNACGDSSVMYILHSLSVTRGYTNWNSVTAQNYFGSTNAWYGTHEGGDYITNSDETGDDGNADDGDGCSSSGLIEPGYTGTGDISEGTDDGGDGFIAGTRNPSSFCDDGNLIDGDGCSSLGDTEIGWLCENGTLTTSDNGTDVGGDGFLKGSRPSSTYCDDGNSIDGDGCDYQGLTEEGYYCSGGSSTTADTCIDLCGDGKLYTLRSPADLGDDGNTNDDDGGSSTGRLENNFSCSGASLTTPDIGIDIGGDGVLMTSRDPPDYCDDGNSINGDGGSASGSTEQGYFGNGGSIGTSDYGTDLGGDGILIISRPSPSYGDDGNNDDGDGCSSTCSIDSRYVGSGATTTTADIGTPIGGDGYRIKPEEGDDSNSLNLDGCSNDGIIEYGYICIGGDENTADVGIEGADGQIPNADKTICESQVSTMQKAILGVVISTAMITSIVTSITTQSSAQSTFATVNQIQLILILILISIYLPEKVEKYIQQMTVSLISFDLKSIFSFYLIIEFYKLFEFDQSDKDLKSIDINSGSTFINMMSTLTILSLMIGVHLIIGIIHGKIRWKPSKPKGKKFMKKLCDSYTFGAYIRLFYEISLICLLSSISELYNFDTSSSLRMRSFCFTIIIALIWIAISLVSVINLFKVSQKDYFNCDVKEKTLARSYTVIFLTRRLIYGSIAILIPTTNDNIQVILISFVQIGYGVYAIWVRPFNNVKDNIIEIVNELFFLILVSSLLILRKKQLWGDLISDVYLNLILISIMTICVISVSFLGIELSKKCGTRRKVNPKKYNEKQDMTQDKPLSEMPSESAFSMNTKQFVEEHSSNEEFKKSSVKQVIYNPYSEKSKINLNFYKNK